MPSILSLIFVPIVVDVESSSSGSFVAVAGLFRGFKANRSNKDEIDRSKRNSRLARIDYNPIFFHVTLNLLSSFFALSSKTLGILAEAFNLDRASRPRRQWSPARSRRSPAESHRINYHTHAVLRGRFTWSFEWKFPRISNLARRGSSRNGVNHRRFTSGWTC